MAFRYNYWTCSKFADWLRGTPSIKCGTSKEWREWRKAAKAAHPWRYWFADVGLRKLQDFVYWPVDLWRDVRWYLRNRWYRSHLIDTGLEPGYFHEAEDKILHGMFAELVDYVEIQCSGWEGPRRSRENGLKHLDWEISLRHGVDDGVEPESEYYGKPTPQSVSASEIKALYLWWLDERPNRLDPVDLVPKKTPDRYLKIWEAEEAQHQEDEDMLIRLVKIRRSLWT